MHSLERTFVSVKIKESIPECLALKLAAVLRGQYNSESAFVLPDNFTVTFRTNERRVSRGFKLFIVCFDPTDDGQTGVYMSLSVCTCACTCVCVCVCVYVCVCMHVCVFVCVCCVNLCV